MRTTVRCLGSTLIVALLILLSGCAEAPLSAYYSFPRHHVVIRAAGGGSGEVKTTSGGISIECGIVDGVAKNGRCDAYFMTGSSYKEFVFLASPDVGSSFVEWDGCSRTDGTQCGISWTPNTPDTTFTLTGRFEKNL